MVLDQADPKKEALNVKNHKISLTRFEEMTGRVIVFDAKHSQVENRYNVYGYIDGRLYVATITYRSGLERVISLRVASRRERKHYDTTTQ